MISGVTSARAAEACRRRASFDPEDPVMFLIFIYTHIWSALHMYIFVYGYIYICTLYTVLRYVVLHCIVL